MAAGSEYGRLALGAFDMRKLTVVLAGALALAAALGWTGSAAFAQDSDHIGGFGYGHDGFFGDPIGGIGGNGTVTDNHVGLIGGTVEEGILWQSKPRHLIVPHLRVRHAPVPNN